MDREDSVSANLSERVERRLGRDVEFGVTFGRGTFEGDGGISSPFFPFNLFFNQYLTCKESKPLLYSSPSSFRGVEGVKLMNFFTITFIISPVLLRKSR